MSQSAPASTSRAARRPTLGLIAQILGIAGAAICILAIAGILMGRGMVQERVELLANGAVKALDQAIAVGDQALAGLEAGAQNAQEMRVAAEDLAANPAVDELAISALQERLSPLSQRYAELRDRYVVLREKASGFITTAQRLDRLIPGIELPGGPVELVASMDEKLVALDQAITDLSSKADDRTGASATAAAIAAGATQLESGIAAATELTQSIQDELVAVQADVNGFAGRVESLIGVAAIALAIVLAWGVLLHGALWALGRRWRAA